MPLVPGSIRSISPPTLSALYSSKVCQPGLPSVQAPPQLALLNEIAAVPPPLLPQAVSDAVTASRAMMRRRVFRMATDSIGPGTGQAAEVSERSRSIHRTDPFIPIVAIGLPYEARPRWEGD